MAEQTYTLPEEPVYHEAVRKLQRQDPANADTVLNPLIQMLLENTDFVRRLAMAIEEQNTADHAAIRRETAQAIGSAIAAIPTPDVSGQISVHNGASNAHAALFQALREALTQALNTHANNRSNPHGVTAAQVGAAASGHSHTAAQVGALPIGGGTLTGNLRLQGSGNYGTAINLGDGDYVHISEPIDDVLELKGKSIRFVTTQASGSPLPVSQGGTGVTSLSALKNLVSDVKLSLVSSVPSSLSSNQVALVYV